MPRRCAVPYCRISATAGTSKYSMFCVPKDIVMLKKWEGAIPGIIKLERTSLVCEQHFDEKETSREWIKRDSNGQIIAQVPYKCAQLSKVAVPTKFSDAPTDKRNGDHDYAKSTQSCHLVPKQENSTNPLKNSQNIGNGSDVSVEITFEWMKHDLDGQVIAQVPYECPQLNKVAVPTKFSDTSTDKENGDHEYVKGTQSGHLVPKQENSTSLSTNFQNIGNGSDVCVESAHSMKPSMEVLSTLVRECPETKGIRGKNATTCAELSTIIPKTWTVCELRIENGTQYLFSYMIMRLENGVHYPITQKCVTIDASSTLNYFVYARHINQLKTTLDQIINNNEMLRNILVEFQMMKICTGLGDIHTNLVPADEAYQDNARTWRSKNCSLVSEKKKCNFCATSRKHILQRTKRLRIRNVSNPDDRCKLSALRMKNKRERRRLLRAEERVKLLMTRLKEQEAQIASMKDMDLDTKCAEWNIPSLQKSVLKEIITAASRTNAKGRRYTEEWMMLCMLMNIRSQEYYEFLRKNNILPLPCTRTIRSYFSLINTKCSSDEELAELLTKHLASKTPMQRHGVPLLDEINPR